MCRTKARPDAIVDGLEHLGYGQAINAGDALFAAAHFAVVPTGIKRGCRRAYASSPGSVRPHDDRYRRGRRSIWDSNHGPDVLLPYLRMIAGKTAAIVRFAAWAGAMLGGADEIAAERWGRFGQALGIGFQIRAMICWGSGERRMRPAKRRLTMCVGASRACQSSPCGSG